MQNDSWHETGLQAMLGAGTEAELFQVIAKMAQELGFDYCAYGMRMPLPLINPKTILLNNYSSTWQERYGQQNYLAVDPTVAHGLSSVKPLIWSEQLFAGARVFWDDAAAHGLKAGWSQSSFDAKRTVGMLTLARSSEPLTEMELRDKSLRMSWMVQAAHESLSALIRRRTPETEIQLTAREIEVLRWTADGKTSADVGQIVNISERTVNFHINNAIEKLGVANKTAAVIKALLLHLL